MLENFQPLFDEVQFSSVPRPIGSSGGHEGRFSRASLPVFSAGGPSEQFWHWQRCPLFDVVRPAFPLPAMASPTLQGALKDGFGEAVVAYDMSEPCKFPSPDSCQKRLMWTHKEVDLTPHPVVGLVLQVGDAEVSSGTWFRKPGSPSFFHRVSKEGPCFTAIEEDGGDKRFVELDEWEQPKVTLS